MVEELDAWKARRTDSKPQTPWFQTEQTKTNLEIRLEQVDRNVRECAVKQLVMQNLDDNMQIDDCIIEEGKKQKS